MAAFSSIKKCISLGLTCFFALSGCTTPVTPDFSGMSMKYAKTLEQYQIDMILFNIVHSSKDHPLSFLDMPNITGTGSVVNNPSVSGTFINGSTPLMFGTLSSISPSWGLQVGNSFNFSQSSLNNSVFWKAFLTEIPLDYVQYFIHNHIPREVLFSLIVDEIIITAPDGKKKILINNPLRPEHPEFQKLMYELISYGLGIQPSFNSVDVGNPITKKQLVQSYGVNAEQVLAEKGMKVQTLSQGSSTNYQIIKLIPTYKLCIKKNEYNNFVQQNYGNEILCESSIASQAATPNKTQQARLNIVIRSTKNIYDYLGQVVTAQHENPPYVVTLPPSKTTFVRKNTEGDKNRFSLLVVDLNKGGPSLSSVVGLEDNVYSIPRDDYGYSGLVINLLAQFLILAKAPNSIPSSPAVLIR